MTKELDIRLIGAAVPEGEISIRDLNAITAALQELAIRIARDVVHTPGPGRTKQFMEEAAQLRLRGVRAGSTILSLAQGPSDKLAFDLPDQAEADARFWELIAAVSDDRRPEWVSDLIAESAGRFVEAVKAAAPTVVLTSSGGPEVSVKSDHVHPETWSARRVRTDTEMSAAGRLEKVDLRSHEFRVRDDVGQPVELRHVDDDDNAAKLVGSWVIARGAAVQASSGRLLALDQARVEPVEDPAAPYVGDDPVALADILASAPGPDPDAGIDMTDDEFASFLEAARS